MTENTFERQAAGKSCKCEFVSLSNYKSFQTRKTMLITSPQQQQPRTHFPVIYFVLKPHKYLVCGSTRWRKICNKRSCSLNTFVPFYWMKDVNMRDWLVLLFVYHRQSKIFLFFFLVFSFLFFTFEGLVIKKVNFP